MSNLWSILVNNSQLWILYPRKIILTLRIKMNHSSNNCRLYFLNLCLSSTRRKQLVYALLPKTMQVSVIVSGKQLLKLKRNGISWPLMRNLCGQNEMKILKAFYPFLILEYNFLAADIATIDKQRIFGILQVILVASMRFTSATGSITWLFCTIFNTLRIRYQALWE